MKNYITKWLRHVIVLLGAICLFSFPSFAADIEGSYGTTDSGVYGWAWHKGHFGDILTVKVLFYYDNDMSSPKKALSLTADKYNKNVEEAIGDGWHYFEAAVDWDSLGGKPDAIKVYAVYNDDWIGIGATASGGSSSSSKASAKSSDKGGQSAGPGTSAGKPSSSASSSSSAQKGKSLGTFSISGYCTCEDCIIGQGLTSSGKKPVGNHTIAADLNVFPLGTKLWIDGIVYTVEDTGGGIVGNKLDIYFDTHSGATSYGRQTKEVFEVIE